MFHHVLPGPRAELRISAIEIHTCQSLDVTLNHARGQTLRPSGHITLWARVATSFGRVIGKGRDANNRPVVIDTADHPVVGEFDYDKKVPASFVDQMYEAAAGLVARLVRRRSGR